MKKLIFVVLFFCLFVVQNSLASDDIRIGWQIPWNTQGQLVQVLKHTNILQQHGLAATFIGRTYGPELNEAAIAGEVDVIFTATQPAAVLFSKDKGWVGIGRLMYNRTVVYVPKNSPIKKIADLKGKIVGVPVGAEAEKGLIEALLREGLNPKKDTKIVNIGIKEQVSLVIRGGQNAIRWDNLDALCGFDPTPAIFESQGLVRVIDVNKVVSLVLMSQGFIDKNPKAPGQLMSALVDAYDYYRQNVQEANLWFMKEAGFKEVNHVACDLAASIEPNLRVKTKKEIRMYLDDSDFTIMRGTAKFVAAQIKKEIKIEKYVDNKYTLKQ